MDFKKTWVFWAFWDKRVRMGKTIKKIVQTLLQILNPLSDTEILAPELVSDQSEMVV